MSSWIKMQFRPDKEEISDWIKIKFWAESRWNFRLIALSSSILSSLALSPSMLSSIEPAPSKSSSSTTWPSTSWPSSYQARFDQARSHEAYSYQARLIDRLSKYFASNAYRRQSRDQQVKLENLQLCRQMSEIDNDS